MSAQAKLDAAVAASPVELIEVDDPYDPGLPGTKTDALTSVIEAAIYGPEKQLAMLLAEGIVEDVGDKLVYALQRSLSPVEGRDPLGPLKRVAFIKSVYGLQALAMLSMEDATANRVKASWVIALSDATEAVVHRLDIDDFNGLSAVAVAVAQKKLPPASRPVVAPR